MGDRLPRDVRENMLRNVVLGLMLSHPLPWTIEQDWTVEVVSSRGTVAKLGDFDEAVLLIAIANRIREELDDAAPAMDALLSAEDPPA